MKRRKLQSLLMLLVLIVCSLSGCNRGPVNLDLTETPVPTQKLEVTATPMPTATEKTVKIRNLNGLHVIIGDTYSPETTPAPTNAQEEATKLYREDIMQKYNYPPKQKAKVDVSILKS